jgi:hypothetical protein
MLHGVACDSALGHGGASFRFNKRLQVATGSGRSTCTHIRLLSASPVSSEI